MIAVLMMMNILGTLCGMTMVLIALLPRRRRGCWALLRRRLKKSTFSLREYLPVVLAIFLFIAGAIEGRHPHLALVSTNTLAVIDATPEQTWKAIQFYEQVRPSPPWLLR